MSSESASIDASQIDRLAQKMDEYGDKSGKIIQEYLKVEGYERIAAHIPELIHNSGRNKARWKNKATVQGANPETIFRGSIDNLTLTVSTNKNYDYLYFPDDGSNTKHHFGNQQFMLHGAENASDEMIDEMVERLAAAFTED